MCDSIGREFARLTVRDRKDFYFQWLISLEREATNTCSPGLSAHTLAGFGIFPASGPRDRRTKKHILKQPTKDRHRFHLTFRSQLMGDHAAVAFAQDGHGNLLRSAGCLKEKNCMAFGRRPPRSKTVEILIIDDLPRYENPSAW